VSRRSAVVALLVVAVAAAALVRVVTRDDGARTASECAAAGVERPLPADFPASFPLPPGTRVTQGSTSAAGSLFVQGAAPLSAIEAATFLRARLVPAGWRTAGLQEREGAGTSAGFRGHGFTGTWTIDEVPGCPAAALLTLRFRRA
jgi:hypothetical protein